jgi:hypothetical protein
MSSHYRLSPMKTTPRVIKHSNQFLPPVLLFKADDPVKGGKNNAYLSNGNDITDLGHLHSKKDHQMKTIFFDSSWLESSNPHAEKRL